MSARFPYSPAKIPPIPAVILDVYDPTGAVSVTAVSAHLDTAADRTIVPLPIIRQLGLTPVGQARCNAFGGVSNLIDVYLVRFVIPNVCDITLRVPAHAAEPYVLVGRDILNRFRVTFDGPNQVSEFH